MRRREVSVEENKTIQRDHHERLKASPPDKSHDDISYQTLKGFLCFSEGWDKAKEDLRVLDLGCGTAEAYPYLSEHDYYGIECVEENLEEAKSKVKRPENLKLGMIEQLPFEDGFFDVVWARHVLEHSSDLLKTFDEIIRVLKPDGLLIYALPQGVHDEPAHIYQTNRLGWFKLLSTRFDMLNDGEHPFNLNEYYGVCRKPRCQDKWAKFLDNALPYEQAIGREPYTTLIHRIIDMIDQHDITAVLETGFGTGYVLVYLAERFERAHSPVKFMGIEISEEVIVRAKQLSLLHGDCALISKHDIFDPDVYADGFGLVYHQGLLEHFSDDKIQELLKLQVKHSFAVIFSVPSFCYGYQDFGDERLLSIEQWQEVLSPFDVLSLEYYDNKRHILGILKGDFYAGS